MQLQALSKTKNGSVLSLKCKRDVLSPETLSMPACKCCLYCSDRHKNHSQNNISDAVIYFDCFGLYLS